ncbi:hypothetical protein R5R35_009416 [Gryllus longicercus]|uniref:Late endosomal/lysosomal adaptor and MAPK and MTOR activator 4 n=1 Tax=Gryllus longicercus TaxID=2509291 RepID=A0AAN9VQ48_9ORTH|nr:Ragulator complex protein LAMTOR4 homolog [Gryllus bimaculatus]
MLNLDRIPDQVGYLIMAEDGAVISSGGELENNERIADIISGLISLTDNVDLSAFQLAEGFKRISVTYDEFAYVICLSNKKVHVVKRRLVPSGSAEVALA